jgi:hypothetical protein
MTGRSEPALEKHQVVDQIRRSVQEHVTATSLRNMARELKFSASSLSKFLDGGQPYRKSFVRLQAWYARHHRQPLPLSQGDAADALTILAAGMEESRRVVAERVIIEALGEGFADNPPDWLAVYTRAALD